VTYWEAFTQAKDKENPDGNEDRLIVVPNRLYAVLDGATDKSGKTHGGLTGGQIAGRVLEEALRNLARDLDKSRAPPLKTLLDRLTGALARRYRALGLSAAMKKTPWARFSAQASIVIEHQGTCRFLVIGDTGLRLNGTEAICGPKAGDVICSQLRAAVYRHLAQNGAGTEATNLIARRYTVEGLGAVLPQTPGGIGAAELDELRREARSNCREQLSGVTQKDIDDVLNFGLKGLCRFQNRPGPLGFPCFDGTPIPLDMVVDFERPARTVTSIELFSDGYGQPPERASVADWEAAFWKRERDDPERVNADPETKGSTLEKFADDRTVLIVRPHLDPKLQIGKT